MQLFVICVFSVDFEIQSLIVRLSSDEMGVF